MAAAYIRVKCARGTIRTFGGNTRKVRDTKQAYENCTYSEFLKNHPSLLWEDYVTLKIDFEKKR